MTPLAPDRPASTDSLDALLARVRLRCRREPDAAQALLDEARARPDWGAHPDADALGGALESLIRTERGDSAGALAAAGEVLESAVSPRAEALAHYALGAALALDGAGDDAEERFHTAWTRARALPEPELEVDALADLGQLRHRRGDFVGALPCLLEARTRAAELGYRTGAAISLSRLGNVYDRLGDYAAALEAHHASQRLYEALGDPGGEAICCNNRGNVHLQLNEPAAARELYERGRELCRERGPARLEGVILGNLGLAYQLLDDRDRAIALHREALALKERLGDTIGAANSLGNLGAVLAETDALAEAQACLVAALERHERLGDRHGEVHCRLALGKLLARRAQPFAAVLERAGELAAGIRSPELLYSVDEAWADAYRAAGDFERALDHFRAFHRAKEALFNETMAQRTRTLQVLHDVESTRKEADQQRLRARELSEALAEAERQRRLAERLAQEDPLTGLPNRRHGDTLFADAFAQAQRNGTPLSIVLADVDHFKQINDAFSHPVGDAVLRIVAQIFRDSCRTGDTVARFGGEEFLLVLPGSSARRTLQRCERTLRRIAGYDWETLQPGLRVTVSMGVCDSRLHGSRERLLAAADRCLYRAKRAGRNRVAA